MRSDFALRVGLLKGRIVLSASMIEVRMRPVVTVDGLIA